MIRAKQLKKFIDASVLYNDSIRIVKDFPELASDIVMFKIINDIVENGAAILVNNKNIVNLIRDIILRLKRLGYCVEEHDNEYIITVE